MKQKSSSLTSLETLAVAIWQSLGSRAQWLKLVSKTYTVLHCFGHQHVTTVISSLDGGCLVRKQYSTKK